MNVYADRDTFPDVLFRNEEEGFLLFQCGFRFAASRPINHELAAVMEGGGYHSK